MCAASSGGVGKCSLRRFCRLAGNAPGAGPARPGASTNENDLEEEDVT